METQMCVCVCVKAAYCVIFILLQFSTGCLYSYTYK